MLLVCGPYPAAAGVASSLSSTINPPSTNFRIVCCRKDRGGCGCSRWWSCRFRFCLIWCKTPSRVTVCPLFLGFSDVVLCCGMVLWWCFS